jgi:hypothetical protein
MGLYTVHQVNKLCGTGGLIAKKFQPTAFWSSKKDRNGVPVSSGSKSSLLLSTEVGPINLI